MLWFFSLFLIVDCRLFAIDKRRLSSANLFYALLPTTLLKTVCYYLLTVTHNPHFGKLPKKIIATSCDDLFRCLFILAVTRCWQKYLIDARNLFFQLCLKEFQWIYELKRSTFLLQIFFVIKTSVFNTKWKVVRTFWWNICIFWVVFLTNVLIWCDQFLMQGAFRW